MGKQEGITNYIREVIEESFGAEERFRSKDLLDHINQKKYRVDSKKLSLVIAYLMNKGELKNEKGPVTGKLYYRPGDERIEEVKEIERINEFNGDEKNKGVDKIEEKEETPQEIITEEIVEIPQIIDLADPNSEITYEELGKGVYMFEVSLFRRIYKLEEELAKKERDVIDLKSRLSQLSSRLESQNKQIMKLTNERRSTDSKVKLGDIATITKKE